MKRNGVDLTEELKKQGWENYFQLLYGSVYTNLKSKWTGCPSFHQTSRRGRESPLRRPSRRRKLSWEKHPVQEPPVPLVGPPGKFVSLPPSVKLKPIASSLPQTNPIYTTDDTLPSTTSSSNQPSKKFNLATTTLPVSEAEMLNETTSPSSSPSPQSPPYYDLSSDTEPSDPHSPTLAQLQDCALASQKPSHPNPEPEVSSPPPENPNTTTSEPQPSTPTHPEPQPSEPIHFESQPSEPTHFEIPQPITIVDPITPTLNLSAPTSPSQASSNEPETTLLTLEEAITVFAESSVEKFKSLTINSGISDDPSAVRTHWNRVIKEFTSRYLVYPWLTLQHDASDALSLFGDGSSLMLVSLKIVVLVVDASEASRVIVQGTGADSRTDANWLIPYCSVGSV
ncbi:extensin-like [Lathyrus oleraceus]|uniref:extensin-like n=1 Tax=Pisum sativum TaxID=3888 RepID=UPI0021D1223E|nr:extensin-like [Pisum sativum]